MPPAGPEQIGTLGTLRDIVAFLGEATSRMPATPPCTAFHGRADPARTAPRCSAGCRATSSVARILLEAVAEKTGYPVEMLELDMRLDADLGIDSIKRVEILSAVQERLPETRSIGPEQTGTLATLREIVEFLVAPPAPPAGDPAVERSPCRPNGTGPATTPERVNGRTDSASTGSRVVLRRLEPERVPLADPERSRGRASPRGGIDLDHR